MSNDQIVSFDDEPLILVNSQDEIVGHEEKLTSHQGDGMLHRAFSIFIFNSKGELLIQQRSEQKPLWPMFWAQMAFYLTSLGPKFKSYSETIKEKFNLFFSHCLLSNKMYFFL